MNTMTHARNTLLICMALAACTHSERKPVMNTASTQTPALTNVESVCPALAHLTQSALLDGVWKRPGLSMRDRSLVTLAALVSLDQTRELPYYVNFALDNGLKPGEISEALVQLAFYSGWENAVDAAVVIQSVFAARGIKTDQLAAVSPKLLALDEAGEAKRASNVSQQFDAVSPGVVQNTTDLLFRDLWLRPGLAPRDRSLVTVASLIATGQALAVPYHLNRALDNGLTHAEAGEVLTQLAFYTGWPRVFSALPVFKQVFEQRAANAQ